MKCEQNLQTTTKMTNQTVIYILILEFKHLNIKKYNILIKYMLKNIRRCDNINKLNLL